MQAIVAKYKLPCRSYLVLLTGNGAPEKCPRNLRRISGDHEATLRLRVVRLWRISASRILKLNNTELLPWTLFLDSSAADLREAFLHRLNEMIITQKLLEESSTYE